MQPLRVTLFGAGDQLIKSAFRFNAIHYNLKMNTQRRLQRYKNDLKYLAHKTVLLFMCGYLKEL